jgi:glycosyltransferase involved in cell wall biosynthesis
LERIAGGRNVVLATGGSDKPPSQKNSNIRWIFSTTLSQNEFEQMQLSQPWDGQVPLRLAAVGRLTPDKNIIAIIDALPEIKMRLPDVTLDILGDGEARCELEARSHSLGLGSSVIFHGNASHEQVLEILSRSHLFVFPTRVKEGFPKAVLEAMACGLPVIATRVSVIPKLLQDGAGILLDDTSAKGVAKAVFQATSDPQKMGEMGRRGRLAVQGYTLEAWSAEIGEHLRKAWGPLKMLDS